MAINVEVIEYKNYGRQPGARAPAPEIPWNAITNVSAAGEVALIANTTVVTVRNRAGGDSVYCLPRTDGSTAAAVGNSVLLAAGESITWHLPKGAAGTDYEIDIRAIA